MKKLFLYLCLVLILIPGVLSDSVKFSFAIISDTHDGIYCDITQGEALKKSVDFLNKQNIDFVVGLGDLVAGGGDCLGLSNDGASNKNVKKQLEEFNNVFLSKLNKPFVPISGNHDYWEVSGGKSLSKTSDFGKKSWKEFLEKSNVKSKLLPVLNKISGFPEGNFRFNYKGVNFAFIGYPDKNNYYGLFKDEINWIDSNIQQGDLVFKHVPPYGTSCNDKNQCGLDVLRNLGSNALSNYDLFTVKLKEKKIKALFSGHTHSFYAGTCDGIAYANSGTLGKRAIEYTKGIVDEYKFKKTLMIVDVLSNGYLKINFYIYSNGNFVKFDSSKFPKTVQTEKVSNTGVKATCTSIDKNGYFFGLSSSITPTVTVLGTSKPTPSVSTPSVSTPTVSTTGILQKCTNENSCKEIDQAWQKIADVFKIRQGEVWNTGIISPVWTKLSYVYPAKTTTPSSSSSLVKPTTPALSLKPSNPTDPNIQNRILTVLRAEWVRWDKGNIKESEERAKPILTEYFTNTNCVFNKNNPGATSWSAAFVSTVMKKAGVNFPLKCSHTSYFREVINNPSQCKPYPMDGSRKLQVGDILCFCEKNSYCKYKYPNVPSSGTFLTHCDIVETINGDEIYVIGGNIGSSRTSSSKRWKRTISSFENVGFISCLG